MHSGAPVRLTLRPAPADSGVVFVRSDLEDFETPADWRHVARVSYATSLMRNGVLISTTEHLLSALYAMGIDNVRLEMDNLEAPILDGGAKPFVDLINQAGVRELSAPRRYIRIVEPVRVADGEKSVEITPCERFELDCRTRFDHPLVGSQRIATRVEPEAYAREIAPARTFGFERDLEAMREMGLIRGATLDNALCFGETGVLNPGGLRFPDECCRHKVLDLIGDLALLGRPLLGKVTAHLAGHALHAALVRKIMTSPRCWEPATAERMLQAAG